MYVGDLVAEGNYDAEFEPLPNGVRVRLSCSLLRPHIRDPRLALRKGATEERGIRWYMPNREGGFSPVEPGDVGDAEVSLFLRTEPAPPQGWQTLLAEYLRVEGFEAQPRRSTGAALFIRVVGHGGERIVVWTFGAGHYLLNPNRSDQRFGLLAVLNRLSDAAGTDDGERRRHRRSGVTRAVVNTSSGQLKKAELIAASPTRADRLGRIDTTSDALASVTGLAGEHMRRLAGGRAMQQDAVICSLDELRRLSAHAIESYTETRYQEQYGWIDRSVPEEDDDVIQRVLEAVWSGETPDRHAVSVDIVWGDQIGESEEDGPVDHFRYRDERRRITRDTNKALTWPGVRSHLKVMVDAGQSVTDVFDEPLRFFDDQDAELGSCTVLELLTAELSLDNVQYVLADGIVWRVQQEFLNSVNDDLRAFLMASDLPLYQGGNEDAYNDSIVADARWSNRGVVLDKCFIRLPGSGQYPVEACDVIASEGILIHGKLKGRSSTLNHLCEQAVVSARLLRRVPLAREQVQGYVIERSSNDDLTMALLSRIDDLARPDHNWSVVFAIVGSWRVTTITAVPLLGRIALRDACQRLADLGFEPKIMLVPCEAD